MFCDFGKASNKCRFQIQAQIEGIRSGAGHPCVPGVQLAGTKAAGHQTAIRKDPRLADWQKQELVLENSDS